MSGDIEMGLFTERMEEIKTQYVALIKTLNEKVYYLTSVIENHDMYMKRCFNCGLKWEDTKGDIPCPRCHNPNPKIPMTLERAIEILNERNHHNSVWTQQPEYDHINIEQSGSYAEGIEDDCLIHRLSEFEAIAVAREYDNIINQQMTLERAVEVLNERKHQADNEWEITRPYPDNIDEECIVCGDEDVFSEFEAIAIAEKYEREGK